MMYTYEINPKNQTILVTTIGDLLTEEVVTMGLNIMFKAIDLKCKIVFDNRLSKNRISVGEAYYLYSTQFDNVDTKLRSIPIAYISNEDDWDFYSFFECTCTNRGIPIRVFHEEDAAIKWLEHFDEQ